MNERNGLTRHSLLEKVGLSLERDHLHEVEGVGRSPVLLVSERDEESIGDELDVLAHESTVHLKGKKRGEISQC